MSMKKTACLQPYLAFPLGIEKSRHPNKIMVYSHSFLWYDEEVD